jgi:hypothetical protein
MADRFAVISPVIGIAQLHPLWQSTSEMPWEYHIRVDMESEYKRLEALRRHKCLQLPNARHLSALPRYNERTEGPREDNKVPDSETSRLRVNMEVLNRCLHPFNAMGTESDRGLLTYWCVSV